MLPSNVPSTTPVSAPLYGGRNEYIHFPWDIEEGGIAFNDTSEGLRFQNWHTYIEGDLVITKPDNADPITLFTAPGTTEVSLTFNQNMSPVVAYVQNGVAKLYWFDALESGFVHTVLGAECLTPRVTLDNKDALSSTQNASNDVLVFYVKHNVLCQRIQRERYQTEHQLWPVPSPLIKVGKNRNNRMEWIHRAVL